MLLKELREIVCEQNKRLVAEKLVRLTSGNVSGKDQKENLMVIKPSGLPFDQLTPENMVVMNMDGKVVEGELKPSSDAYTHLVVYRNMSWVNGVTHTHSNYATAWAAIGKPIPVCLTAQCDSFGCEIPLGKFCLIGHEQIGIEIVNSIGNAKAILMQNHGVFAIGKSPKESVNYAVTVEDIAKTMAIASAMGNPKIIDPNDVKAAHERYVKDYGQ